MTASDVPDSRRNNALLHPVAIAAFAVIYIVQLDYFGDALVGTRRLMFFASSFGFLTVWTLLFLIRLRIAPEGYGRKALTIDHSIFWLGSFSSVVLAAALIPIADPAMQIAIALCLTGTAAVLTAANARFPVRNRFTDLVSLVVPVGSIVILLAEDTSVTRFAAGCMAFFTLLFLLQRRLVRALTDSLEIARAAVEAEQATRLRFIASASHDLGQPLQSARMFLDQALRANAAPARDAAGRKARWAFDSAETMLHVLIDHLRLDAGAVTAIAQPQPAGPLLARVAALHEPAARLAGIDLRTLPSSLNVIADAGLAERALGNLVANAIRHAKCRRLLVGARRHGTAVRLWVIDDGRGITPADHPCLFADFAQGSDHGDEVRGGFGLGLASAQRMAGLMDGRVGHDPRWDKGSAFFLELRGAAPQT